MRRNVKNEKVIRAMAIGISAMLMASSPLTTLAAEPGEGSDDNKYENKTPDGVCDEAQTAAENASGAVNDAETDADTVKNDVKKNVVAGEAGTDSEGNDLAQAVIDAAENVENVNAEDVNAEDGTPLADAKTAIGNTNTQLDVAEANDELSDAALDEAKDAADDASTIASDMKDAMDEAETKVDEQLDEIKNATTTTDANAAYDELEETAKKAEEDFNTKLEAYDEAKKNYEDAAKLVADAEAKYNKAIETADANATAAAAELAKAKANAEALEAAVAVAKAAVDDSSKDAMEIADLEDKTREDGGLNWKNEDKLFIAIMEKYYLPELMGIEGAKVTRIQGKDNNEYNYFTAEYTENGEKKVKYYNFKMDNGSKDDIVIFEKREVEIFGDPNETPDQYVKENDPESVVDVAEGLENGTVVDAGGKYYEYESKEDKTLVSDSEVTGTSKEDVFVDEENAKESWQYDAETDKLVKTVTADVTTVTYTDKTFTSDKNYATDEERNAAAADKKAELEEATGKDATVTKTEETTYTYTASGTYIPTFTKEVDVNKEYESGYLWYEADSKKEAKDKALDWAKDEIDDDLGDYYLVGDIKSDLSVTMTEEETEKYKIFGKTYTRVTDDADYLVTGTVTATYAKVTKKTVSQSTFGSLWDDIQVLIKGGQSTNEKLEETARKAVEAEGGIFVSADWADWKFNKATIRYVAGVKVTTYEKKDEQAAKDAVESDALAQAKAKDKNVTGVYNVKTTGTNTIDHTTYSYTVDYLKEDTKTTETKEIATETYSNAKALTGQIIQNKNYYDAINNGETDKDKILLTQKDDNYRAFVDNAKNLTAKYERLATEAQKAREDVEKAQAEVVVLQNKIKDLKDRNSNLKDLEALESQLAIAKDNRDKAEETLKDILDKLNDAGTELEETIARLTPAPTGGEGTDDTTDDTETTVTTPVVLATVPAATVNVVAPAPVAQPEVVEIEEEEAPLAPAVEENKQEETKAEPESQETIQLDDEATPLADIIVEDEQTKMSWWWLLIVALLGATGYEMYKKHNEKKQKVQAENAEDAE